MLFSSIFEDCYYLQERRLFEHLLQSSDAKTLSLQLLLKTQTCLFHNSVPLVASCAKEKR